MFAVFAAAVAVSLALVSRLGLVQARPAGDVSEDEEDEEDEGVLAGLRIRLLRGYALFSSLPAPVLEGLARELQAAPVRPGRVVIAEGDVGDRFYLVSDGRFEVTIAGSHLRELGPGDGFGEIALLRDVRRTATITARSDGLLYGLERDP